jgi:hypothetical protein
MSMVVAMVAREIREALPAILFFPLAFYMIAATKAFILADYKISKKGSAIAAVGALMVAKAVLVVPPLLLGRGKNPRPATKGAYPLGTPD